LTEIPSPSNFSLISQKEVQALSPPKKLITLSLSSLPFSQINNKPLTKIINETHENPKYLPGIPLPPNIIATPDVLSAVKSATLLIFVLPHQFIPGICKQLKAANLIKKDARALSMIKGVEVKSGEIRIFADVIEEMLGIGCCALSGANIANEGELERGFEDVRGVKILRKKSPCLILSFYPSRPPSSSPPSSFLFSVYSRTGQILGNYHWISFWRFNLCNSLLSTFRHSEFQSWNHRRCSRSQSLWSSEERSGYWCWVL